MLIVTQSLVPPAAAAVGIVASRSLAVSSLIYHPLDPHTQQTTPCRLSIVKLVVLPATATLSRGENLWSSRLTYSVDSYIQASIHSSVPNATRPEKQGGPVLVIDVLNVRKIIIKVNKRVYYETNNKR